MASFFGKIKSIQGNELTLEVDDLKTYQISKFANHQQPLVQVELADNRYISPDQRRKIYAVIGDIANYTGYSAPKEMPDVMKFKYLEATGQPYFSLSDCSMTQANEYLTFLIDFCFENNIGFKSATWDLLPSDYGMVVRCCKFRKCILCGQHADLDHTFGLVGMGRNRKVVDNSASYFLPLCREHHTERHQIGVNTFIQKYHIKPVKLTLETRRDLGIGRN